MLSHLNHISLSVFSPICSPPLQGFLCYCDKFFIFLFSPFCCCCFFFRVKMCTRPAENHPKKTLQRFCCGQESWRRPKLKAKRCFLQQKVNGMELFIYDKHIDLLNVFIVAISWNLLNDPLFPKPCWAKLQFLLF